MKDHRYNLSGWQGHKYESVGRDSQLHSCFTGECVSVYGWGRPSFDKGSWKALHRSFVSLSGVDIKKVA